MIFYISHNFAAREWLTSDIIPVLEHLGHKIQARWITEDPTRYERDEQGLQNFAMEDFLDISACDYLIHFSEQFGGRPELGKFVEVGYAAACGKRVLVVQSPEVDSVFYYTKNVRRFYAVNTLLNFIAKLPKETAA